jgi:hypothetical protein
MDSLERFGMNLKELRGELDILRKSWRSGAVSIPPISLDWSEDYEIPR